MANSDDDELAQAIAKMREACDRTRGYAPFFEYPPDRDEEEVGVVESLAESLLVSGEAIRASKVTGTPHWREWDREAFLSSLAERLIEKDAKHPKMKGGSYHGGYVVVVHTDEPLLSREFVQAALEGHGFSMRHITRAFLLLSYDPKVAQCPWFELMLVRAP